MLKHTLARSQMEEHTKTSVSESLVSDPTSILNKNFKEESRWKKSCLISVRQQSDK